MRAPARLQKLANQARLARNTSPRAGRLGRTVSALTPGVLRSEAVRARWRRVVFSDHPPADAQLMLEMRRRYKPDVEEISEYLGRDLVTGGAMTR